jgi:hypothetical protein
MRNSIDFSSWQGLLSTVLGLALVSLVAVGIRLLVMHSVQQRRERANRQINERLKTLIGAYKTLGGSFTGELAVDPSHRGDWRRKAEIEADDRPFQEAQADNHDGPVAQRRRRIRDAVEAALSDVILLGTEAQVRLAARAADEMVAGRPIKTAELVASLRDFIRDVLDLEAIPAGLTVPMQGPLRAIGSTAKSGGREQTGGGGGGQGAGGANGSGAGIGVHRPAEGDEETVHG